MAVAEEKNEVSEDIQDTKPKEVDEPAGKIPGKLSNKATRGTLD